MFRELNIRVLPINRQFIESTDYTVRWIAIGRYIDIYIFFVSIDCLNTAYYNRIREHVNCDVIFVSVRTKPSWKLSSPRADLI